MTELRAASPKRSSPSSNSSTISTRSTRLRTSSARSGRAAHVNLQDGKAFCFMSGPDEEIIRKAHEAIDFPYNSITEVRRVTGADMRIPLPVEAQKRKAG